MIAIDTQLLIYAHRAEYPWHARARERIASLAGSGARWAIPMHCLVEFYANVTRARRYSPPSTPQQAILQTEAWLGAPTVSVLTESAATWAVTAELLAATGTTGSIAYDARIAAVCLQHGVTELWTHDRDFSRFQDLRTRNPLADPEPGRAGEARAHYTPRARMPKAAASVASPPRRA